MGGWHGRDPLSRAGSYINHDLEELGSKSWSKALKRYLPIKSFLIIHPTDR